MRRVGLVGLLLGSLALAAVGAMAYQIGVSAGTTQGAVSAGATVVSDRRRHGSGHPVRASAEHLRAVRQGTGDEGTGLGLSIARDLVIAHGGTITALSPPGRDTRIETELPTGA